MKGLTASTPKINMKMPKKGPQSRDATFPESILYKSIAGRYRPVRVADGPITARYRFMKNACWVIKAPDNQD